MRHIATFSLVLCLAAAGSPALAAGPRTPEEIASFVQPLSVEWKEAGVPGAVLVVVRDGQVLFRQGFGAADPDKRLPVDPERTVFRSGAGFPTLVGIAVLQLAEEGRLDFQTDVNRYLKRFQVPATYPEPVTLHHLMTHTAGLDETFVAISTLREEERPSLGDYLAEHLPPRIRPPGGVRTHSPFGYAVAGHIVEEISGMSFPEYAEQRILRPLGMTRSSFVGRPDLLADLAPTFRPVPGALVRAPIDHSIVEPDLYTTAADMSQLVLFLLGQHPAGGQVLREEESFRRLHRQQFAHHPQLPGPSYGQFEAILNGKVGSTQSGSRSGHSSELFFLPEEGLGLFLAVDVSWFLLLEDFNQRFMDHFYPATPAEPQGRAPDGRIADYVGLYRHNRYPRRSIDRWISIVSGYIRELEVGRNEKGEMTLQGAPYVELEPEVFQRRGPGPFLVASATDKAVFRRNGDGSVSHLFVGSAALEKIPWYESAAFVRRLSLGFFILFASAVLLLPLGALLGRRRRRGTPLPPRARTAWMTAWLVSALGAAFLGGLVLILGLRSPERLAYGVPGSLRGLLVLPLLGTVLTAALLVFLVTAWRERYWGTAGRLYFTLVALVALAFVPFLIHWRLLGLP